MFCFKYMYVNFDVLLQVLRVEGQIIVTAIDITHSFEGLSDILWK